MKFGIPKQGRSKKEEKYPETPVMTMDVEGKKGTARKIIFNNKACELMGLDEKEATVAFSFDGGIYVANGQQSLIPEDHEIKVTKNSPRRISDKNTYTYIAKVLDLDTSVENEFKLVSSPIVPSEDEPVVFKLELMGSDTLVNETKSEVEKDDITEFKSNSDTDYNESFDMNQELANQQV